MSEGRGKLALVRERRARINTRLRGRSKIKEIGVSRVAQSLPGALGLAITTAILAVLSVCPVSAQNLEAGKAGAQIFAEVCSGCHRSARELRSGASASFLREHYTTGSEMASTMAAYLASATNDPRSAPAPKRAPVAGVPASAAPQQATADPKPVTPPQAASPANGKPRPGAVRADAATKPVSAAEAKPTATPPARVLEEFEE
jgi:hypothetical protein